MVLGVGMVVSLLLVGLSSYVVSNYVKAKPKTEWTAAVAAAQAGIDDYLTYLNKNAVYWQGRTPATPGQPKGYHPDNPAMSGWAPVPGSSNGATFHYEVDDDNNTAADGMVRLTASGRVAGEVRTLKAMLHKARFFDYVYFSDIETMDPANVRAYVTDPEDKDFWDIDVPYDYRNSCKGLSDDACRSKVAEALCSPWNFMKGWGSRDKRCLEIWWSSKDRIDGRFHTNDQFFVDGQPQFNGSVTSGCPDVERTDACYRRNVWVHKNSSARPKLSSPAQGSIVLKLPASNEKLANDAKIGGCVFTGPTRIVLKGNRMAVHSPNTKTSNYCATASSQSGVDTSSAKLPENGVVYVQELQKQATNTTRPWVRSPDSPNVGFPVPGDVTTYAYNAGNVFIEGTLDGRLTVGAQNDIIVTGNLKYTSGTSGSDVLGLVANSNVSIHHPVDSSRKELGSLGSVEVWAAILAVKHSFNVQNYSTGTRRGELKVNGSIAQKWRGAYGTGNSSGTVTGYDKVWKYDPRLTHLQPPLFLEPERTASWTVAELAEGTPYRG